MLSFQDPSDANVHVVRTVVVGLSRLMGTFVGVVVLAIVLAWRCWRRPRLVSFWSAVDSAAAPVSGRAGVAVRSRSEPAPANKLTVAPTGTCGRRRDCPRLRAMGSPTNSRHHQGMSDVAPAESVLADISEPEMDVPDIDPPVMVAFVMSVPFN